jgi:hypothetical protein
MNKDQTNIFAQQDSAAAAGDELDGPAVYIQVQVQWKRDAHALDKALDEAWNANAGMPAAT